MLRIFSFVLFLLALAACQPTDDTVHQDFSARRAEVADDALFDVFDHVEMQADERQAMEFLYAYMPLPDMVDYDGTYYLRNVRSALQTRREMPWGRQIPEREFRHFVLPVRVNNETLDSCRWVFYAELRDRVAGLSMADAILEVNHWCHEHVTYTPSDSRTSSPLASIRTAYGRCGEESTLTVAALRAVGIPARQVYTPRWAHTDDNHAWVEAWADGQWHFLGACEPEPVLDLGWFNAPASRGMLMHTKAFGRYDGPEETMLQSPCYTEINVTRNYAPVATACVLVTDTVGQPVAGADVEFKIYNYAEFYTVSRKQTDAQGLATLEAGMGDLVAWACHEGRLGLARCHVADGDTTRLMLAYALTDTATLTLDIVPPVERNTLPDVSDEARERNTQRLAYEDSLRAAYVATFDTSSPLLVAARGNYAVIGGFLQATGDEALLLTLSSKDLRDVPMEVLMDHYANAPERDPRLSVAQYDQYVRCPRVANEWLTPYRSFFCQQLGDSLLTHYRQQPQSLVQWVADSIALDEVWNPQALRMQPMGVWRHRHTDAYSRGIFFVALARCCGLAARIDPVTDKVQLLAADGQWAPVNFVPSSAPTVPGASAPAVPVVATGVLRASYAPQPWLDDPKYYTHFTVSALHSGFPSLLNYAEEDTYRSLLREGQRLDAGPYLLVTGTRLASGSVLAHVTLTQVAGGQTCEVPLVMRQSTDGLQVIGHCNSNPLLPLTGRGYFTVAIIAPNHEPTNHILRDISLRRAELEAWGRPILLLFRSDAERQRFRTGDFPDLPSTVVWGVDEGGAIEADIRQQMQVALSAPLPLVFIGDTFDRVVFFSQGYTIGLGDQLHTAVSRL